MSPPSPEKTDNRQTSPEAARVEERYARRRALLNSSRYSPLMPDVYMSMQENERALIHWLAEAGLAPVQERSLLEIGCGSGTNLRQMLRLGFQPENLKGNELLADRVAAAHRMLPPAIEIFPGDAAGLELPAASFDVVYQSTVFSSILDDRFQRELAERMWGWVKPGGGVLWYDFIYDNPSNPDVRGVTERRIGELFPHGERTVWRVTLAPPLSRLVTRVHPALYTLFNALPLLRTHLLCWIKKR
jgi:SAM-dependent methyltransferase